MISVSFLKSKYDKLTTIKMIDDSNADLIHVDLMDGIYVEEKNFTLEEVMTDLSNTKKKLDIHLMVVNPYQYIKELVKLNVYAITVHLDVTPNIIRVINFVNKHNIKIGLALNPDEDVEKIRNYIYAVDYVLVMSVVPGKGGQTFIKDVLNKVETIEKLNKKDLLIGIDGGINQDTIKYLKDYRIDNIVSGSYVCMSDDYNKAIEVLRNN